MQLVQTSRDNLLRPLQMVSGIVVRKHAALPILTNILIRKDGNAVSFLSTDTEKQIMTFTDIGNGDEKIEITVEARKLVDILRAFPETADITLTLDDKRLLVQSGKSRFVLQTLSANDFPTMMEVAEYETLVELPQKDLKALFGMVYFAMAQQDIRYYLNGLLLITNEKTLSAVATDGHRLAYCQVETAQEHEHNQVIIPNRTILELQRLLDDTDNPVQIDIGSNQIKFSFNGLELISKLVEGKFPDYARVIPKGYKNSFSISREQLQRALQRSAIMTNDKFKAIRCVVDENSLKISSTNTDQEEAIEELDISYSGDRIDIGFNVTYLLDVLNNQKSETIVVELGDANSSALITIPDNLDFKYVVMPMRI